MNKTLYERDFQVWIEQTICQLENQEFASLDIEHLIEELRDLGKSEKHELESNLSVLIAHLLKLKVQHDAPLTMQGSWYDSIDEHRQRVKKRLSKTPSLKPYLPTAIAESYSDARQLAIRESKRAKFGVRIPNPSEYPISCPFSSEQLLDEEFYGI